MLHYLIEYSVKQKISDCSLIKNNYHKSFLVINNLTKLGIAEWLGSENHVEQGIVHFLVVMLFQGIR